MSSFSFKRDGRPCSQDQGFGCKDQRRSRGPALGWRTQRQFSGQALGCRGQVLGSRVRGMVAGAVRGTGVVIGVVVGTSVVVCAVVKASVGSGADTAAGKSSGMGSGGGSIGDARHQLLAFPGSGTGPHPQACTCSSSQVASSMAPSKRSEVFRGVDEKLLGHHLEE